MAKADYDKLYSLFEEEAEIRRVEASAVLSLQVARFSKLVGQLVFGHKVPRTRNHLVQISLMVEGQAGLTWSRWRDLVSRIDDWGFAGLYRSDHFTMRQVTRENALEMIVSLTYVADHTRRVHFGPLVAPVSFREPVMLARQAAQLDDLSDGRMILGVGAGWQDASTKCSAIRCLTKKRAWSGLRKVYKSSGCC